MGKWLNWKPPESTPEPIDFEQIKAEAIRQAQINARQSLNPEPTVCDGERMTLREIYQATLKTGSHLFSCQTPEQANRFNKFLMHHLPIKFASLVIRKNQINTFTEFTERIELDEKITN